MKTHPTSIPASARHYEVQGVQRGVFYQFWLTATNGLGEGKPTSIRRYRVLSRDAWNDFRRGDCYKNENSKMVFSMYYISEFTE